MQKEEITPYVIKALGRNRSQNDIVQYLCENANITWPEAEKLVRQIQVRHGSEISSRQSPLIIAIGIMSLLTGVLLIAYGLYSFFMIANKDAVGMASNSRSAFYAIGAIISGFGLITGSIIGMWKNIKSLFEDRDNR